MKKKPARKKYTRRNKTPNQKITELEQQLDREVDSHRQTREDFRGNIFFLEKSLEQRLQQIANLNVLANNQYTELTELREINLNLIEIISKLGNNLRTENHEKRIANSQLLSNTLVMSAKSDDYKP